MATVIELVHDYPVSAERLWQVATDWGCLQEAMKGLVTFYGLPDTPIREGETVRTEVSILGVTPKSPWVMEVLEHDEARRVVRSHEHGGAVKRWDHTLTVRETAEGARLTDRIEIDAGWLTPLYAMWGRFMYRRRHEPRLRMLGLR